MKKSFIIFMTIIVLCLAGCYEPDSRRTVESQLNSALTDKYKYVSFFQKTQDGSDRKTNIYNFVDENGIEFCVSSGWYAGGIALGKGNNCNYADVQIENAKENIEEAARSDLYAEWSGVEYRISVNNYSDLEQAAICVERAINAVSPFSINRKNFERYYYEVAPQVNVLYRGDWVNTIGKFDFLCEGETWLTRSQILDKLQYRYADYVKLGRIEEELSAEELTKYPASVISSVYLNDVKLEDDLYEFTFSDSLNEYVIKTLDPCQDFEGSYNYSHRGMFSYLITEIFGGTYECEDWKATWTIGGNTWNAELKFKKKAEYDSMEIYKNGEKIDLSETNMSNGSVSGRAFTLVDLEKMLGVTAKVDQLERAIYLRSDPE